jgi:hypothetical protein
MEAHEDSISDEAEAVKQPRQVPMRFLSWNCRRLGNPCAIRDLHLMVKEKGPKLVFLMETKICNKDMDFLENKTEF